MAVQNQPKRYVNVKGDQVKQGTGWSYDEKTKKFVEISVTYVLVDPKKDLWAVASRKCEDGSVMVEA